MDLDPHETWESQVQARWRAFTDEELEIISDALHDDESSRDLKVWQDRRKLAADALAELQRRRITDGR